MIYEGQTVSGKKVTLAHPLSVKISMDEDAPAHSFTGVFAMEGGVPDLLKLLVWQENQLVFQGILDEQTIHTDADGSTVRLTARSMAAVLLDNEALPQTYVNPSLRNLFSRHAKPYGFVRFEGNGGAFRGKQTIRKGMSEWQVFTEFCQYFLGVTPFMTVEGILNATGKPPGETLVFSCRGGIPYFSFTHRKLYHKRIGELYLQTGVGGGYSGQVTDVESMQMGIQRRRYIAATNYFGSKKLKAAKRRAEEVVLACPAPLQGTLGACAVIADWDGAEKLTVAKINYTLDSGGEICRFTLRKAEDTRKESVT